MRLIAQMVGQLDLHRPFHQPLGQLREQPPGPGDLLLGLSASQQPIDHLIRDPLAVGPLHHRTQCRVLDGVLDQPLADLRPVRVWDSTRRRRLA